MLHHIKSSLGECFEFYCNNIIFGCWCVVLIHSDDGFLFSAHKVTSARPQREFILEFVYPESSIGRVRAYQRTRNFLSRSTLRCAPCFSCCHLSQLHNALKLRLAETRHQETRCLFVNTNNLKSKRGDWWRCSTATCKSMPVCECLCARIPAGALLAVWRIETNNIPTFRRAALFLLLRLHTKLTWLNRI